MESLKNAVADSWKRDSDRRERYRGTCLPAESVNNCLNKLSGSGRQSLSLNKLVYV